MPNLEEHCQRSQTQYGVRAEDIHRWMDDPRAIFGPGHRSVRHDVKKIRSDPNYIPLKFRKKYGLELATNIMFDHIILDKQYSKRGKCKGKLLISGRGITYIPQVILNNLRLDKSNRMEIPYLVCPNIVLLYNPNHLDKLADNLKLLLAKILFKQGDLNNLQQILNRKPTPMSDVGL